MKNAILALTLCLSTSTHAAWYEDWSARPAWPEPISLTVGSGLTLTTLAFRKTLVDDFQSYESTRRPLGRWSTIGDIYGQALPNALYASGMILAAVYGGSERAAPRAQIMISATAEAVLITTLLKYTIRERRPDSNQHNSFPSGHTTSAFAFAGVIGVEHGWKWGLPAYALAGLTGWSRINDNKHYLHDVLAGATVGVSTALGIHYARGQREKGADAALFWGVPLKDGAALFASWSY